jgi:hypothetical protein
MQMFTSKYYNTDFIIVINNFMILYNSKGYFTYFDVILKCYVFTEVISP